MPMLYGGRIAIDHLKAFMGRPEIAAQVITGIQDVNGGVGLLVFAGQAGIEPDDGHRLDRQAGLFLKLTDNGGFGAFAHFDPTGGEAPEGVIDALFEEYLAVGVE